jgi:hypothetical protein
MPNGLHRVEIKSKEIVLVNVWTLGDLEYIELVFASCSWPKE